MSVAIFPFLAAIAFLSLLIVALSLSAYLAMVHKKVHGNAEIEARLLRKGEIKREWIDRPWIVERIASPSGYDLEVRGLAGHGAGTEGAASPEGTDRSGRLVLLHHGISWNWLGMLKYAWFLHEAGYTVVLFDARGHGSSGGVGSSFGIHESRDLLAVADWARKAFPGCKRHACFGISLGAASVLQYAPLEPSLAAVVADCPFSGATAELDNRLSHFLVPRPARRAIVALVDLLCVKLDGFSLREASPARACLATEVPIFFIHGLEDDYVPTAMSEAMVAARRMKLSEAITELWLVPGAGHARSHRVAAPAYEARVLGFLDRAFASGRAAAAGAASRVEEPTLTVEEPRAKMNQ